VGLQETRLSLTNCKTHLCKCNGVIDIKQMPPQIIHILHFCAKLAAPDFVMECTEARTVRWPEFWKFYGSLTLLHFPTGEANDAHNVRVDTAHGKDNDQQNL